MRYYPEGSEETDSIVTKNPRDGTQTESECTSPRFGKGRPQRSSQVGRLRKKANNTAPTRREVISATIGAITIGTAGCLGSSGDNKPPLDEMEISLVDVRVPSTGLNSATIPLILSFTNPTDQEIPEPTGDLDISLNDSRVAGEEIVVDTLEPGEETDVNIDIVVEYTEIGSGLVDAITSGTFNIQITGNLSSGGASRSFELSGSA